MLRLFAFLLLLAFLLTGCTPDGATPKPNPRADSTADADSTRNSLPDQPGVPLAQLIAQSSARAEDGTLPILDRLNLPTRLESSTRQNIHVPSQTDTVYIYHYEGLMLDVYKGGHRGKEILRTVRVTEPGYTTADGLHVGPTRRAVEQVHGQPDRVEGDTYIYDIDRAGSQLRVRFDTTRVSELNWSYYFDG